MSPTMTAAVCPRYGPPEVLELSQVDRPCPEDDELLVRIRATSVSAADCAFLTGVPFSARLYAGLRRPRWPVLGGSFAGVVEAVGTDVRRFSVGEEVFGTSPNGFGAHAEYLCIAQGGVVRRMTAGMTHGDAVSLLDATTAFTFLHRIGRIRVGQRVLVNGASGAVGSHAVQLAKQAGAQVSGVCSTANVQMVSSLGADAVIDYTEEDFTRGDTRYDIILDAVGTSSFSRCRRVLSQHGVYLSTVPSVGVLLQMARTSLGRGRRARFATTGLMRSVDDLDVLARLFESEALRSVIDRSHPLAEIAEAYRYVLTGRKRGTLVITL